jgi:hypothetical protein
MSFYDDLKSGLTYLVNTGADIYKEQLKQETEQDRIDAANKVTEQLAGDSFMIGDKTYSIKKTLLIMVGILGTVLILRSAK